MGIALYSISEINGTLKVDVHEKEHNYTNKAGSFPYFTSNYNQLIKIVPDITPTIFT